MLPFCKYFFLNPGNKQYFRSTTPSIPFHSQYFRLLDSSGMDETNPVPDPEVWFQAEGIPAAPQLSLNLQTPSLPPLQLQQITNECLQENTFFTHLFLRVNYVLLVRTTSAQFGLCETWLGLPDLGSGPKVSTPAEPRGLQRWGPPRTQGTGLEFQSHVYLLSPAESSKNLQTFQLATSFPILLWCQECACELLVCMGPLTVRLASHFPPQAHSPRQYSTRLCIGS